MGWNISNLYTVENADVQASTVPSLTMAMARFLARASLRSSTLVSSMSSSWNQRRDVEGSTFLISGMQRDVEVRPYLHGSVLAGRGGVQRGGELLQAEHQLVSLLC